MTKRFRLLDLFCGAGGATKGLQRAGFHVTGVDLAPQPRYCGDAFIQANALTVSLEGYDAYWASPPCQGYSTQSACRAGLAESYPKLIEPIRERLKATGKPYVIENVGGARKHLIDPIFLCGSMFGRATYRHRFFESNVPLTQIKHAKHSIRASRAGHWEPGTYISVAGNCSPISLARQVMDIDWTSRRELAESIPPYFASYVGKHLIDKLETELWWKAA